MKKISHLLIFSFIVTFSYAQVLEELSFYPINGTMALEIDGQTLYLGSGDLVDISDPIHPILKSQVSIMGGVSSLKIEGDYAYYGGEMSNNLTIADISDSEFPLIISTFQFTNGHGVFGMSIKDEDLFLALGSNGSSNGVLCSMDISDKSNPQILQTLIIDGGQCRDVAVKGQYAYLAHYGGLKVVDISDPSNMQVVNSIGGGYNSVSVEDNLVCVGKSGGGVDLFDISTPTDPSPFLNIPNSSNTAWSVYLIDRHVYLASNSDGLFVYKINDDSYELVDNFSEVVGQTFDVAVGDSIIAVPGLIEGVSILAFDTLHLVNVNEFKENYSTDISPNPVTDKFYLNSQLGDIQYIDILDAKGLLIRHMENISINRSVDISDLASGVYLINISTTEKEMVQKIIKK